MGVNVEKIFEDKLGSQTVIESGKGHFDEKSGVIKLQRILSEVIKISSL